MHICFLGTQRLITQVTIQTTAWGQQRLPWPGLDCAVWTAFAGMGCFQSLCTHCSYSNMMCVNYSWLWACSFLTCAGNIHTAEQERWHSLGPQRAQSVARSTQPVLAVLLSSLSSQSSSSPSWWVQSCGWLWGDRGGLRNCLSSVICLLFLATSS